jgi:hypothetical protein
MGLLITIAAAIIFAPVIIAALAFTLGVFLMPLWLPLELGSALYDRAAPKITLPEFTWPRYILLCLVLMVSGPVLVEVLY